VEALGADGGSTAAAVCGASLSLADAGVALRSLVAAVSVGLISEGGTWDGESRRSSSFVPLPSSAAMPPSKTDAACTESGIPLGFLTQSTSGSDLGQYELLTDPCGIEAALGDMELRVAGTADGITAAQLDVRVPGGIPMEALEAAFKRASVARLRLLTVMQSALPQERCARAPVFDVVQVPPSCIGAVLGKEGSNLRSIEAATGCRINVENDGALCVYAPSRSHFEKARLSLRSVTGESMQKGEVYRGKIVALKDFGAWVAFPGSAAHALLHISEVAMTRIRAVEDVLAAGQSVEVVFMGRDNRGTLRVSRKAALKLQQEDEKREQKGVAQDGKRHGDENEQPLRTA
jgi:polyribonucleotide nucleotidyltransferase